jgi:hypothetical protein
MHQRLKRKYKNEPTLLTQDSNSVYVIQQDEELPQDSQCLNAFYKTENSE